MKTFFALVFFTLSVSIISSCKSTQQNASFSPADIISAVNAQRYIFRPQTVTPLSGPTRQLSYSYFVKILKDSVISYLPYIGQAYSAPINPSQNSLDFTSTQFDYAASPKKDGWNITIKPKDNNEEQQLFFTVASNGFANLQVISTNKQSISFNGFIQPVK
jgi:hypothetical protein